MMSRPVTSPIGNHLTGVVEQMRCDGALFILVGPAGVGKNTIMAQLMQRFPQLGQMPTMTTREIRPTEQEGREHYFVSLDKFRQLIAEDALVEYQEVYPGKFYGTPRQRMEEAFDAQKTLIADIEVLGASRLKEAFSDRVILIFVAPPSPDDLEKRLRARGHMSEEEIAGRLERAAFELSFAEKCDYRVINDTVEHSTEVTAGIIEQELVRRGCRRL